jgi:hypothetical protein
MDNLEPHLYLLPSMKRRPPPLIAVVLVASVALALPATIAQARDASAIKTVAAACTGGFQIEPASSPGHNPALYGVAAASPSDAWGVGVSSGSPLIEHFTGSRWRVAKIPKLGRGALHSVAAKGPDNVWAVGNQRAKTLVLRWNGKTWSRIPTPVDGTLWGISFGPAGIWAVGSEFLPAIGDRPLALHWTAHGWVVTRPPGYRPPYSELLAVAEGSASSVWAVGYEYAKGGGSDFLADHWNGSSWKHESLRNIAIGSPLDSLTGVTMPTKGTVLAVGYSAGAGLYELRKSRRWTSSRFGINSYLQATAKDHAGTWAVGATVDGGGVDRPYALRWTGSTLTNLVSEQPVDGGVFNGVGGAGSYTWAVGSETTSTGGTRTLVERMC